MNPLDANSANLIDHLVRLSGTRDRDSLLRCVTQALAETSGAREVQVHGLVLDENQRFWLPLTQARPGTEVQFLSDPMRIDRDVMIEIGSQPERLRCLDAVAILSTALVAPDTGYLTRFPVVRAAGSSPWGVVEIASEAPVSAASRLAVERLLTVYCNMLDLLDYSECDALTGLWNRKPFDDLFYKAIAPQAPIDLAPVDPEQRSPMSEAKFWLAMVDIDHFKLVNDRFGHLIGDEVLLLVGRLLKASFRAHDRVYRFGGEEFVVVLRCADHDSATAVLERFRERMASFDFPQAGHITASVGFTEIVTGDSPAAACERADKAVYFAKHHGRNQVCSETDLVRRGLLTTDVKEGVIELF